MKLALIVLLAAGFVAQGFTQVFGTPNSAIGNINFRTFQSGSNSRVARQSIQVIETEQDFMQWWQNSLGRDPLNAPTRSISWGREKLVAIHLGQRGTGGYSVFVQSAKKGSDNIVRLSVVEQTPVPGQYVSKIASSPYTMIRIDRGPYSIAYDISQRQGGAGMFGMMPGATGWNGAPLNNGGGIIIDPTLPTAPGIGGYYFRTLDSGTQCQIKKQSLFVLNNANDLQAYWQNTLGRDPVMAPSRNVDWNSDRVIAIHLGERPTGGFSVYVISISKNTDGVARIRAIEKQPTPGTWVSEGITSPYVLVKVPRAAMQFALDIEAP